MKKIIALTLALVMVLGLAACGSSAAPAATAAPAAAEAPAAEAPAAEAPAAEAAAKTVLGDGSEKYLTVAACPASSALYPFWVSIGSILDAAFTNVHATVSESQGAVAITKRVRSGECELGNSVAATDYESFTGTGKFDGAADPDLRMIFYYEATYAMHAVDKNAGVTDVTMLDGKDFNPGGTGTTAEAIAMGMAEVLGYAPKWFVSSQADASDAYSNRKIIGTVKLGPQVDSYVMQLNAAIPCDLVSLTQEQADKITAAYPYLIQHIIPANTYDGIDHDTLVVGTPQGCQTRVGNFTQEEQYQIFKAVVEDYQDMWKEAYPVGAQNDLIALTLASPVTLAAGTVQYLVEHGYEVPAELIPAEYVA